MISTCGGSRALTSSNSSYHDATSDLACESLVSNSFNYQKNEELLNQYISLRVKNVNGKRGLHVSS